MGVCWEPPSTLGPLGPCKPHLLSGTDPAIRHVTQFRVWDWGCGVCGLLSVQVFKEILGSGCGRCRNMLEPLPDLFWSLPGAPRRRPLRWRQLLPRSKKHGDLRELHHTSFGCIPEPFGQRRVGELKASLLRIWGDVRQVRHSKTMRLRVERLTTKSFGRSSRRARELNATGLSPCCLQGSEGGGARVSGAFTQGRNSSAIFRSCRAFKDGACAAVFL